MKKQICALLAGCMLAGMFTGCQKTQTVEPTAMETPVQEQITYNAPDRFTGDWTGLMDTFKVHADASIQLPDLSKLSTATVERRLFTQADADKLLEVFTKGNPLYERVTMTKQDCQRDIEEYEAMLRGEILYPSYGDGSLERVPSLIENRKYLMTILPNEGEKPLADTKFHVEKAWNPDYNYTNTEIQGYAEVDGTKINVWIQNQESFNDGYGDPRVDIWREGYSDRGSLHPTVENWEYWDTVQGRMAYTITPSFSVEKAQEMGDEIISQLGLNFTLDYSCPTLFYTQDENYEIHHKFVEQADGTITLAPDAETGYILIYVRNVNGLPLTRTSFSAGASDEENPAPGSFYYEYIRIIVNQDGMVYFNWDSPYTEPQIQSTNIELLPFEKIQEIFGGMIFVKNAYWLDYATRAGANYIHDMKISEVKLNLMRVRDAHTLGPAKIVPVWDFYGTDEWYIEGQELPADFVPEVSYEIQMTIDAINGNVYDRELGY